jgi:hypothetical protein
MIESLRVQIFRPMNIQRAAVPSAQRYGVSGVVLVVVGATDRRDLQTLQGIENMAPSVGESSIDQQIPNPVETDLKTQHPGPSTVKPEGRDSTIKLIDLE